MCWAKNNGDGGEQRGSGRDGGGAPVAWEGGESLEN